MASNPHLRADRLNTEPPIFRGCSYTELTAIVVLSVVIWLPLSFVLAGLAGRFSMGLGIATLGVLVTVFLIATWFQRIKRGRPFGYYQQRVVILLHDSGLRPTSLIRRSGYWDIGRSR